MLLKSTNVLANIIVNWNRCYHINMHENELKIKVSIVLKDVPLSHPLKAGSHDPSA